MDGRLADQANKEILLQDLTGVVPLHWETPQWLIFTKSTAHNKTPLNGQTAIQVRGGKHILDFGVNWPFKTGSLFSSDQ